MHRLMHSVHYPSRLLHKNLPKDVRLLAKYGSNLTTDRRNRARAAALATAVLGSLIATGAAVSDDAAAGRYEAVFDGGSCRVSLSPSAPPLPEALVRADTRTGLAIAAPNCPAGLDSATLWSHDPNAELSLSVFDASGALVYSAAPGPNRDWVGATAAGQAVRLRRR